MRASLVTVYNIDDNNIDIYLILILLYTVRKCVSVCTCVRVRMGVHKSYQYTRAIFKSRARLY